MTKIYELACIYSNQKSFGGKAKIREEDNSKILVSYNTDIVKVSNGEINHYMTVGHKQLENI